MQNNPTIDIETSGNFLKLRSYLHDFIRFEKIIVTALKSTDTSDVVLEFHRDGFPHYTEMIDLSELRKIEIVRRKHVASLFLSQSESGRGIMQMIDSLGDAILESNFGNRGTAEHIDQSFTTEESHALIYLYESAKGLSLTRDKIRAIIRRCEELATTVMNPKDGIIIIEQEAVERA